MTGSVELNLTEAKKYKYVQIRLYGHAHVHWTETRTTGTGDNQRTETVSYTSNETYVDQIATLWSNKQTPHEMIGPGMYNYQFQFTIPPDCPSSFQGSCGYIRYQVLGRIGTGLFRFDQRINAPIQVCQILDINQPQYLSPVRQMKQKQVGCLCCVSGNVEFTVNVPRTGFCINRDRIPLSVVVENGCGRSITVRAEISKLVTFFASGNRTFSRKTVALVGSEIIPPHSTEVWNPENLLVPMIDPTLLSSKIIKVEYTLKVSAVIPYAINPSIKIPVFMGNVPFEGSTEVPDAVPPIDFANYAANDIPWAEDGK